MAYSERAGLDELLLVFDEDYLPTVWCPSQRLSRLHTGVPHKMFKELLDSNRIASDQTVKLHGQFRASNRHILLAGFDELSKATRLQPPARLPSRATLEVKLTHPLSSRDSH